MKRVAICIVAVAVGLMVYIVAGCAFGRWCGYLIALVTGSESFGDFMSVTCGVVFYVVMGWTLAGLGQNWEDK